MFHKGSGSLVVDGEPMEQRGFFGDPAAGAARVVTRADRTRVIEHRTVL